VNAFPWDTAPRFLIRDRDRAYGLAFSARMRGRGIREIRTAVRAPQMNAFVERVIGTLRRDCFDHLIVLNERHAQRLLGEFRGWYNQDRVHLALDKDAPDHRATEPPELGKVVALPCRRSAPSVLPSRGLRLVLRLQRPM
jgi:putative transposase